MENPEPRFRGLLSELLDGDLSQAGADELSALCAGDERLAARLRAELELVELTRCVLQGEAGDEAFCQQIDARIGEEPFADAGTLIRALLDGDLGPAGMDELARHCWRDESVARELKRALHLEDLLHQAAAQSRGSGAFLEALETRMWAMQEEDKFVAQVASKIVRLHPDLPPPPQISRFPAAKARSAASRVPWVGGWAAAAAAVALLAGAIDYQPAPAGLVLAVAEITRAAGEVHWDGHAAPAESRYFAPGRYRLESGVVTVAFASGAEMTVEGPADFEVRGEREAFVHSGVALLAKNSLAEGGESRFVLGTQALDLGEAGEMVGLVAQGAAAAEAVVLEGDGSICLPELGLCRDLFAMEPVRAELGRKKLFDIPYNPDVFARAWEVNAGIESNTGSVRVEPPSPAPQEGNPGEVQLIVEKIRFLASREIEVDTLHPGQFASITRSEEGLVLDPAGRELRSFLLQWRPGEGEEGGDPMEASVTFDQEIVGVIYSPDRLAGSDSLVGAESLALAGDGPGAVGIPRDGDADDQILLSDDRRTVNLRLRGGGSADRLDHVRVLVALR